jgi:type IV secretory pathway VirJ component
MTSTLLTLAIAVALADAPAVPRAGTLPGGRFGTVEVMRPAQEPARAVLFLSDEGGWGPGPRELAVGLARDGALVIGISTPRWVRSAQRERCAYPAGDLESLAQAVQKRLGLRSYLRPILVGEGTGAAVAYAALAQAPVGSFLGALGVGGGRAAGATVFCRGSAPPTGGPKGRDLGSPAGLPAAVLALDTVERAATPAAPSSGPAVADLPLVEVPAAAPGSGAFALLVTGDGGWAGIDRELAAAVAANGLPVVGLDSLKYFWTRRTPESFASDLGRIIEHYAAALGRPTVALIGYSRGADVLPAATALLASGPRARVKVVALLGPGRAADFELHVTDFISSGSGGRPILPDVERLAGTPVLCLYGRDEEESLCPLLRARPGARLVELAGGHHFGGDYGAVAREVVRTLAGVAPGPSVPP